MSWLAFYGGMTALTHLYIYTQTPPRSWGEGLAWVCAGLCWPLLLIYAACCAARMPLPEPPKEGE